MSRFYPMHLFRQLSFLCLIIIALPAFSQTIQPAKWQFSQESLGNDEYLVHFDVTLDKGWNIYSQFVEEGGPVPTSFTFDKMKKVEIIGKVDEKGEHVKEGLDPMFEIHVKKYSEHVRFTQKVKAKSGGELIGHLEFMTCDDEKCLPPASVEFSFKFDDSKGSLDDLFFDWFSSLFSQASAQMPGADQSGILEPVKWSFRKEQLEGNQVRLVAEAAMDPGWYLYSQHIGGTEEDIRPVPTSFTFEENIAITFVGKVEETGDHVIEKNDPLFDSLYVKKFSGKAVFTQIITASDPAVVVNGSLEYMTCNDEQCLPPQIVEFSFGGAAVAPVESAAPTSNDSAADKTLLGIFIAGFLGGLIALITPCVFPMIPMTVSFFTKSSKTKSKGIANALIYGASIIVIYLILGITVTKILGPDAPNILSSSAFFNILFFVVFVLFAISFFGFFEITLPSSFVNSMDRFADKGGLIGIFFMAFTLALVSFSCTGPIIGTLLVESAKGSTLGPTVGMFGFSLALALPFGLFAAFPGWLNSLPKSGGWLNAVKVVLGFVELGLALKFLSNVDLAYHLGFLKREIFLGVWILLSFLTGLYLLGIIKFPHDGKVKRFTLPRIAFATPFFAFTIYLVTGMSGGSLKLLSGFPPPEFYSIWNGGNCPHDINCFKDFEEGIKYARLVKKPVLVDFTGWSCVNCRKMEENVWVEPDVLKYLKDEYVLISLYVDDRTPLPESEQKVSPCTNKKVKTLGNKWSAYQACTFNQNSQPYYVLMNATSQDTLNQPVGYTPNKEQYIRFLQQGLDKFKTRDGKLSSAD